MPLLLLKGEGKGRGRMSKASRRLNTKCGITSVGPAAAAASLQFVRSTRACFSPFCCHYLVSAIAKLRRTTIIQIKSLSDLEEFAWYLLPVEGVDCHSVSVSVSKLMTDAEKLVVMEMSTIVVPL